MDNEPILNEPGITKKNPDYLNYHNLVEYRNFSFSIYELIYSIENFYKYIPIKDKEHLDYFYSIMKTHYVSNKDAIMKKLQEKKNAYFILKLCIPPLLIWIQNRLHATDIII